MPVRHLLPDVRYFVVFLTFMSMYKILPGSHFRLPCCVGTSAAENVVCFEITNEKHEKCPCRGTAVVWQCCGMWHVACVRKNDLVGENNYLNYIRCT